MEGTWRIELDATQYRHRMMEIAEKERLVNRLSPNMANRDKGLIGSLKKAFAELITSRESTREAQLGRLNRHPTS